MHRPARWLLLLLLTLAGARAHPILQNPVWVAASPDRVTVELHVSVRELIVVQGLPVTDDGRVDALQAEDLAPKHSGYLLDHWLVKADGALVQGTVQSIKPPKVIGEGLEGPDRAHFTWTVEYPLAAPPRTLSITQNMCVEFPSSPGVPWDLSYAYRYGPHGETPWKFGVLPRDLTITFNTGFAPGSAEAGSIVRAPRPATLLGLWIVFLVACVLGSSANWTALYPYIAAVIIFAAGLAAGRYATGVPVWLVHLVCGAVAILTAADNIHRPAGPALHRRLLLCAGCLAFGTAFSAQERLTPELPLVWHLLPLPAAIAAVLLAAGLVILARRHPPRTARLLIQLGSLLCCLDAAWLMLQLLEVL